MKSATAESESEARFRDFLKEAQKELQQIRRVNRQLDSRIKRSSAAIQRNMDEIRKNIDHVKAVR